MYMLNLDLLHYYECSSDSMLIKFDLLSLVAQLSDVSRVTREYLVV